MEVEGILLQEGTLALVGAIVGGVWSAVKSSEWFRRRRLARHAQALRSLEAAVEETYRDYVRAIKDARADGRLTRPEIRRARLLARQRALQLGRSAGIDLLQELGVDYIDMWIARLVKRMKAAR